MSRRTPAGVVTEPAPSEADQREWYSGGTLHRSTASEWRAAAPQNRLATAADWAAAALEKMGRKVSLSDLRPYADAILTCSNEAILDSPGNLQVAQIAALCWVMLNG